MRAIIYIGILLSTIGCNKNGATLRTGDLLFQAGPDNGMAGAISAATGKNGELNFIHVGILVAAEGCDSVLEATTDGGVRMTELQAFLKDAVQADSRPRVVAMRLRDTTGIAGAVARARKFLGQPYDYAYLPDNGKLYCSELVRESYLTAEGRYRFTAQPMNFRAADGTMPVFWEELFVRQGMPIPEGVPGTNPNDLSKDAELQEVYRWF